MYYRMSAWSAYRECDNACFPMMNLMITGKCNFNYLGLLFSGRGELAGLTCKDVTKCCFFEGGWYQKIVQALPEWTNLSEIGA